MEDLEEPQVQAGGSASSSRSAAPAPASPTSSIPRAGSIAIPRPPTPPAWSRRSWTTCFDDFEQHAAAGPCAGLPGLLPEHVRRGSLLRHRHPGLSPQTAHGRSASDRQDVRDSAGHRGLPDRGHQAGQDTRRRPQDPVSKSMTTAACSAATATPCARPCRWPTRWATASSSWPAARFPTGSAAEVLQGGRGLPAQRAASLAAARSTAVKKYGRCLCQGRPEIRAARRLGRADRLGALLREVRTAFHPSPDRRFPDPPIPPGGSPPSSSSNNWSGGVFP